MTDAPIPGPHNLAFAEELYAQYLEDPSQVEPTWRSYFDANWPANGTSTPGHATPPAPSGRGDSAHLQDQVDRLVAAYRARGHRFANVDVLALNPPVANGPSLEEYGLSQHDLDTPVSTQTVPGPNQMTLGQLVAMLQETYCRTIGAEFMHIEEPDVRNWLRLKMESARNRVALSNAEQLRILTKLTAAEVFEQFLHTKFVGAKRFSLEGGESLIPMLDLMVEHAGNMGVREVVLGMAHRGRLNVLANIMRQDPESIFAGFDDVQPERYLGAGDVKYHLGYSTDVELASGRKVHVSLCFNPSHLEFVNPVVEGRTRAKQDRFQDNGHMACVPVLVHGDAAFAGQGVVMETAQLAGLPGYSTGGTIHVVVNNQVGFTTSPQDSRSTPYCTDLGRMFHVPIFHVNGEDPEAVAQVANLAVEFRQTWKRDVIIDLYCYRRHGHNEGDEPSYTQPVMYQAVARKRGVRQEYVAHLTQLGHITPERAEAIRAEKRAALEQSLKKARDPSFERPAISSMRGLWSRYRGGRDADCPHTDTAITLTRAQNLLRKLGSHPEGFSIHPKLRQFMHHRAQMAEGTRLLDWGAAEALAFASLLTEGYPVRLSGQDSGRGTFAHRHSVLRATDTGDQFVPLNNLSAEQARYSVWDSPLSEAGVLGFEYGYSLDFPDALVIWEAQFGDFVNSAQVITDQFICSAEAKWNRLSGVTLFLPHAYEGNGPEHSSARIGRFLTLCAQDNMQICNVTQPAQLFHLLRRQVLRSFRKPLVLFTPKSLLRHKAVVSPLDDITQGAFQTVLPDLSIEPAKARRVLLCSGKVYFDLLAERQAKGIEDVAVVRMEQFYPFPLTALDNALGVYPEGTPVIWTQEEPWNQGAWHFIRGRFSEQLLARNPLRVVARRASASPATGSHAAHKLEQDEILAAALGNGGTVQ